MVFAGVVVISVIKPLILQRKDNPLKTKLMINRNHIKLIVMNCHPIHACVGLVLTVLTGLVMLLLLVGSNVIRLSASGESRVSFGKTGQNTVICRTYGVEATH